MKTLKTYECHCGEDFYEDDTVCINCGETIDKTKLVDEVVPNIYENNNRPNIRDGVKNIQEDMPDIKE